jgi:hypothetical protein
LSETLSTTNAQEDKLKQEEGKGEGKGGLRVMLSDAVDYPDEMPPAITTCNALHTPAQR